MAIARETITGTTPQDINKINKNMEQMWFKIFGNLEMSDTNSEFIKNVMTQWIPVQGEGNFDSHNPYRLRFFIPPNTKSITKTSFNIQIERYRMDSTVTAGGGRAVGVDINMSMGSASVGVASVSGGGGSASTTSQVNRWYANPYAPSYHRPATIPIDFATNLTVEGNYIWGVVGGDKALAVKHSKTDSGVEVIDMSNFNHEHQVNITTPPHSHSISMSPHTHSASGKLDLPNHSHDLTEGIKLASVAPSNVVVKLNGTSVATLNGDNAVKNELDISQHINIGQWNTIECTTSNLARINIYGVIELVQKFNVFK